MMEDLVRAAYDAMEPDDATLDRMWDALEARVDAEVAAAAAGEAAAAAAAAAGEGEAGAGGFTVTPGTKRPARQRGRSRKWLPAVAAVLVVAVGVGAVLAASGGRAMRASDESSPVFAVSQDKGTPSYEAAPMTADSNAYEMGEMPGMAGSAASDDPEEWFDGAEAAAPDTDGAEAAAPDTDGAERSGEFSPRTLIVSVEDGFTTADMQALCSKYDLTITYEYDNFAMFAVSLDYDATDAEMAALIDALSAEPGITAVERDAIVHLD